MLSGSLGTPRTSYATTGRAYIYMIDQKELTFTVRKGIVQYAFDNSLLLNPDRVAVETITNVAGGSMARAVVHYLTQEEQVFKYPAGWWQAFKLKCFPRWLLRHYPVKYSEVWAIHKFPELEAPCGKEYVHFKVLAGV